MNDGAGVLRIPFSVWRSGRSAVRQSDSAECSSSRIGRSQIWQRSCRSQNLTLMRRLRVKRIWLLFEWKRSWQLGSLKCRKQISRCPSSRESDNPSRAKCQAPLSTALKISLSITLSERPFRNITQTGTRLNSFRFQRPLPRIPPLCHSSLALPTGEHDLR